MWIHLHWTMPEESPAASGFRAYLVDGGVQDLGAVPAQADGSYRAILDVELGIWTVFVTAYNELGESDPSNAQTYWPAMGGRRSR